MQNKHMQMKNTDKVWSGRAATRLCFALAAFAALAGCRATGVGDPCVPEQVPENGFQPGEAYLETSSVQCRTRVCMVYQFGSTTALDPTESREDCMAAGGDPARCALLRPAAEIDERVYCTCRCSLSEGSSSNTPTCECGEGFTCRDDLLTLGGEGIRGGYCVRDSTFDPDA